MLGSVRSRLGPAGTTQVAAVFVPERFSSLANIDLMSI
jgi:hypothetical protein